MSERPTPETDNERTLKLALEVFTELANTLKRERDEAREILQAVIKTGKRLESERDEALMDRDNGDIATMTRNHYERILQERDEARKELAEYRSIAENIGAKKAVSEKEKAIRERDEWAAMCGRYKQERDEAIIGLTATEIGFDGEANIFTPARGFSDLAEQRLTIRFLRGNTEHLCRAQENPNHFFWNKETENFYYINREKKLFRVKFVEEGAK